MKDCLTFIKIKNVILSKYYIENIINDKACNQATNFLRIDNCFGFEWLYAFVLLTHEKVYKNMGNKNIWIKIINGWSHENNSQLVIRSLILIILHQVQINEMKNKCLHKQWLYDQ